MKLNKTAAAVVLVGGLLALAGAIQTTAHKMNNKISGKTPAAVKKVFPAHIPTDTKGRLDMMKARENLGDLNIYANEHRADFQAYARAVRTGADLNAAYKKLTVALAGKDQKRYQKLTERRPVLQALLNELSDPKSYPNKTPFDDMKHGSMVRIVAGMALMVMAAPAAFITVLMTEAHKKGTKHLLAKACVLATVYFGVGYGLMRPYFQDAETMTNAYQNIYDKALVRE